MQTTRECPRCSYPNRLTNEFCGQCGAKLPKTNSRGKWWIIGGIGLGLWLTICVLAFVFRLQPDLKTSDEKPATQTAPTAAPSSAPSAVLTQSPQNNYAANLDAAKTALNTNYKPNKDPMKTNWGLVSEARKQLESIPPSAKEYPEAQRLMREVEHREKEIDRLSRMGAREIVAEQMEKKMLSEGMDFEFSVSGADKTVLRVKYVLMSRPLVYKLTNETDFLQNLKDAGFKKVIFTDGYDESWTYDL